MLVEGVLTSTIDDIPNVKVKKIIRESLIEAIELLRKETKKLYDLEFMKDWKEIYVIYIMEDPSESSMKFKITGPIVFLETLKKHIDSLQKSIDANRII